LDYDVLRTGDFFLLFDVVGIAFIIFGVGEGAFGVETLLGD
jgi:hypothetical protein